MLTLIEPVRGVNLLKWLFAWMQANLFWSYWIPIFADVFVFTYPVYLLGLYGYGMINMVKRWNFDILKRWLYHKIAALYIFVGTLVSVIVNIGIQYFFDKARPHVVLGLMDLKQKTLLHQFLPKSSFPSDHATVSMSIAMMSLFWGIKNKDKTFLRFGGILVIFSLITSFARIASWVHWPTDVIAGSLVGILIPLLLMWNPVYRLGTKVAEKIGKVI